ncbi:hypothetical protein G4B88_020490 [Cannabis sativa]|uniref:DUF1279 domain-containing protein n=1 Tax=Cannabis sativa TaxID=3483 RepID=A0A7J6FTY2_CANSA|nr:hypothetical protein G4B88_020490 [Cannabis sativa]
MATILLLVPSPISSASSSSSCLLDKGHQSLRHLHLSRHSSFSSSSLPISKPLSSSFQLELSSRKQTKKFLLRKLLKSWALKLVYGRYSAQKMKTQKVGEKEIKRRTSQRVAYKIWRSLFSHSITLSLISFSLCYVLINAGGISANETGEKVGTFALAYAAHKAASPIRFPPTVALTPIVASWIGKKVDKED